MWLLPLRKCVFRRHYRRVYVTLLLLMSAFVTIIIYMDVGKVAVWDVEGAAVTTTTHPSPVVLSPEQQRQMIANRQANKKSAQPDRAKLQIQWMQERIDQASQKSDKNIRILDVPANIPTNFNVHVFYYAWYETPSVDGKWQHWNHEYIPSWRPSDKKDYPTGRHSPPADIGANFFPKLGCYSSRDPIIIEAHMRLIKDSGIGVLVVSWYPPGLSDGSLTSPDSAFSTLLTAAAKYNLRVAPHIEPYQDRNPVNFKKHIQYFLDQYGDHPGLYKLVRHKKELPVMYVYDSYRTPASAWRELLAPNGNITLRGTVYDAIFLGLLVEMQHRYEITRARFDGFYTYFASNGFAYGSTWKNWKLLSKFASEADLLFVPSVGPGYIDTRVRAWNIANSRHRRRGAYYDVAWRTALAARAPVISITSFNEWHEGTQIEPAVPFSTPNFKYLDYEPDGDMFYMDLTKSWILEFSKQLNYSTA